MQESKDKLITDNMGLVYFVVNRYYPTYSRDQDLIQVGMVGLCQAAEAWDENKGQFTTLAVSAIHNAIKNEFRFRSKQAPTVSMNKVIYHDYLDGSEMTLADTIPGDEDVEFFDKKGLWDMLTDKEKIIIRLYSVGLKSYEIAEKLGCSASLVRMIKRGIKVKLGEIT